MEVDVGYCADARWCSRRAPPRFMDYDIQEILTPTSEANFDPRKLDAFWDEADEEVPPRVQKGPAPSSSSLVRAQRLHSAHAVWLLHVTSIVIAGMVRPGDFTKDAKTNASRST